MEPNEEFDTLEDLLEYLIARGETFAVQRLRQMTECEEFDPDSVVKYIIIEEEDDGTGQGT